MSDKNLNYKKANQASKKLTSDSDPISEVL